MKLKNNDEKEVIKNSKIKNIKYPKIIP